MAEIIRGTTPTLKFNFREVNPAQIETAYLVLKQLGAERLKLSLTDATMTEKALIWTLTQEQTLHLGKDRVVSNKWNSKLSSSGTASTRQSTTAYGVYVNSATVSNNTMTMPIYYKQNSNSTGTLNGTYTARVYGVKLYDLIGG